jgi:hypothetical protein
MKKSLIRATLAVSLLASTAVVIPAAVTPARAEIIIIVPPLPPADPVAAAVKKKVWIKKIGPYIIVYTIVDTFGGAIITARCENREMDAYRLWHNIVHALESCQQFAKKFPKKYLANMNKPWGPKAFKDWTPKEYVNWWKQAGGG